MLNELPEYLTNLKNLSHLYLLQHTTWKKIPQGIGKPHFLRTLPICVVSEEDAGCGIAMLGNLNDLRGSLKIYDLRHVKEARLARIANLIDKRGLRKLILGWSTSIGDDDDFNVLEELQRHSNLKRLSIENFGGDRFPHWVSSGLALPNIISISMDDCDHCEHVPSFAELPCLEKLNIESMMRVKSMGSGMSSYRSLKKLHLKRLQNLEEWLEEEVMFPCLEMCIEDCPNLRRAPHSFPSLKSLVLDDVGGTGVVSITSSLTSLASLTIGECEDLVLLSKACLLKNHQLEEAIVYDCPQLQAFAQNNNGEEVDVVECSLQELKLGGCPKLKKL
ncbi:hypothetical protein Sjap_009037 [Stephania japonica]|uniref:R13L1/DRL21-like LRR repeat region domain-containing protein n=1 Tax=Stephania japonica TaxID=461633 RepID=A0AAP0PBE6_9MAGN